jgi:hypothetical protein
MLNSLTTKIVKDVNHCALMHMKVFVAIEHLSWSGEGNLTTCLNHFETPAKLCEFGRLEVA